MGFAGIADLTRESFRLRQENTALHRECERLATLSRHCVLKSFIACLSLFGQ